MKEFKNNLSMIEPIFVKAKGIINFFGRILHGREANPHSEIDGQIENILEVLFIVNRT